MMRTLQRGEMLTCAVSKSNENTLRRLASKFGCSVTKTDVEFQIVRK